MRRFLAGCALAALACSGTTEPARPTVTGAWSGAMVDGTTLSMALVESNGNVTGSAQLGGTNVAKSLTASGTWAAPSLSLTITEGGLHPPFNLTGTVSGNTLDAHVTGSGFTGQAITLKR